MVSLQVSTAWQGKLTGTLSAAAVESVFAADASADLPPVQAAINDHQSEDADSAPVDAGWALVGVLERLLNTEVRGRLAVRQKGRRKLTP
jgi:hypothetical protein